MKKSRKIIFRDFLSAAELADFILNEPTRRSGELVDAANARKVAAIDGVRGGGAALEVRVRKFGPELEEDRLIV